MNAGLASLIASGVTGRHPIRVGGLASAFMEIASAVAFSHRRAFAHDLARPLPGLPTSIEGGRAVLRGVDGTMAVTFDREGRVFEFRAELPAAGG